MTELQARVYWFVAQFHQQHGYPPTVRQIQEALGYGSSSTVQFHLNALRRKGLIEGQGRTLKIVP